MYFYLKNAGLGEGESNCKLCARQMLFFSEGGPLCQWYRRLFFWIGPRAGSSAWPLVETYIGQTRVCVDLLLGEATAHHRHNHHQHRCFAVGFRPIGGERSPGGWPTRGMIVVQVSLCGVDQPHVNQDRSDSLFSFVAIAMIGSDVWPGLGRQAHGPRSPVKSMPQCRNFEFATRPSLARAGGVL